MPKQQKAPKWKSIVLPKAVALWPHLARPDTKFDKDGKYRVKLKFVEEDAKNEVLKFVEEAMEEAKKQALKQTAKKPTKQKTLIPVLPYDEDEEGNIVMNVETKAKMVFQDGTTKVNKVVVYDADVHQIPADEVTHGSIVHVQMLWRPYYMPATNTYGISRRLMFVQLLEKGTGGEFGAPAFKPVDEGFRGEDVPDFYGGAVKSDEKSFYDDIDDNDDGDF